MQKLYNLLLVENSVILFYNYNNFMIYLVILSDFDNLKLYKILEIFFSHYGSSVKIWSHIEP